MRAYLKSKLIFWTIVWLIPINLGKHFIIAQAYISGWLVDYLIPTVYLQDILCGILVILWINENKNNIKSFFTNIFQFNRILMLTWFCFWTFLTTLNAIIYVSSFFSAARIFLYAGFAVYTIFEFKQKDFLYLRKVFLVQIIFLSILAILQFIKQGSIFNNYLILGEQPYSFSTPLINKENYFGYTKVASYGLFSHPNVLGGFLSTALIWTISNLHSKKSIVALFLGLVALVTTSSYTAWLSLVVGIILYLIIKFWTFKFRIKPLLRFITYGFLFLSLVAIFFHSKTLEDKFYEIPSLYQRLSLSTASSEIWQKNIISGVGINQFTAYVENYFVNNTVLRFVQPTHNIFNLILSEMGLVGLILFATILLLALKNNILKIADPFRKILLINIFQIILLGNFDHYFVTIHQTQLLLWFLIGLSFSPLFTSDNQKLYNFINEK